MSTSAEKLSTEVIFILMVKLRESFDSFFRFVALRLKVIDKSVFLVMGIATILVASWFRTGHMLASAEDAIIFTNIGNMLASIINSWGTFEIGGLNVFSFTSIPFFFISYLMVLAGLPGFLVEAIWFWCLLVIGGISISYTCDLIFGSKATSSARYFAAAFYLLNPISLVEIWNRFQFSYMFTYALIPLTMYLFLKGATEKRYHYVILIAFSSILLSDSFGNIPSIFLLWIVLLSAPFYLFTIRPHDWKYVVSYTFLTMVTWIILGSWWIFPLISSYSSYASQHGVSTASNIGLLLSASSGVVGLINVLRMFNYSFFRNMTIVWGGYYFTPFTTALTFTIPVLVFSALVFYRRNVGVKYLTAMSLLTVFLMNGANPPLGGLFLLLWNHLFFFVVFRNPFEKFSIILPIFYSPLIGMTISSLKTKMNSFDYSIKLPKLFKKILPKVISIGIILCLTLILVWPMWTGSVFESTNPPSNNPSVGYYTQVPSYYENANRYLFNDYNWSYRVLLLPEAPIGMTYNWPVGYSGVDIADQIFSGQVISGTYYPNSFLSNNLNQLATIEPSNFWKVASLLSAQYVVVRNDVNATLRNVPSPLILNESISHPLVPNVFNGAVNVNSSSVMQIKPAVNVGQVLQPDIINGLVDINSTSVYQVNLTKNVSYYSFPWTTDSATFNISSSGAMQSHLLATYSDSVYPQPIGDFSLSVSYNLPSVLNLSGYNFLLVWVKSSVSGVYQINLEDVNGSSYSWYGNWPIRGWVGNSQYDISPSQVNEWRLLALPFSTPSYTYNGPVDMQQIKTIGITVFTNQSSSTPQNLSFSGIFVDKGHHISGPNLKYVGEIGRLSVYRLNESVFLPQIYAVNRTIAVQTPNAFFYSVIPNPSYSPVNTVAILPDSAHNINSHHSVANLSKPQNLYFNRVSSVLWSIHVINSSGPFYLVFNQEYDPQWGAYYGNLNGPLSLGSHQSISIHFLANTYANGWLVNKTGNFSITLYFKPQVILIVSSLMSTSSAVILIAVPLGISLYRRQRMRCQ